MTVELWWLHIKAEEKTVAFMLFSFVMQFVYSLEKKNRNNNKKKTKKKKTEFVGGGEGWRGTTAEGQEGQILVADNRKLQEKIIEGALIS